MKRRVLSVWSNSGRSLKLRGTDAVAPSAVPPTRLLQTFFFLMLLNGFPLGFTPPLGFKPPQSTHGLRLAQSLVSVSVFWPCSSRFAVRRWFQPGSQTVCSALRFSSEQNKTGPRTETLAPFGVVSDECWGLGTLTVRTHSRCVGGNRTGVPGGISGCSRSGSGKTFRFSFIYLMSRLSTLRPGHVLGWRSLSSQCPYRHGTFCPHQEGFFSTWRSPWARRPVQMNSLQPRVTNDSSR